MSVPSLATLNARSGVPDTEMFDGVGAQSRPRCGPESDHHDVVAQPARSSRHLLSRARGERNQATRAVGSRWTVGARSTGGAGRARGARPGSTGGTRGTGRAPSTGGTDGACCADRTRSLALSLGGRQVRAGTCSGVHAARNAIHRCAPRPTAATASRLCPVHSPSRDGTVRLLFASSTETVRGVASISISGISGVRGRN